MNNQQHASVIFIKATPEKVWKGLTSPEFTTQYFHSTRIESTWKVGDSVTYYNADNSIAVAGKILELDYLKKLVFTWHVHYNPIAKKEIPSIVSFHLEQVDDAVKLTLVHNNFPDESVVFSQVDEGWIAIMCNLKTLIETNSVMAIS